MQEKLPFWKVVLVVMLPFALCYLLLFAYGLFTDQSEDVNKILLFITGGFVFMAIFIVCLFGFQAVLLRKANRVLKDFAAKAGLVFKEDKDNFLMNQGLSGRVSGTYRNYPVYVEVLAVSLDMELVIDLSGVNFPGTIFLDNVAKNSSFHIIVEVPEGLKEVVFDDPAFRKKYRIFASKEAGIKEIFDKDIRQRMMRVGGYLRIDHKGFHYTQGGRPKDSNRIMEQLNLLTDLTQKIQKM